MADDESIELTLAEIDRRDRIIAEAAVAAARAETLKLVAAWLRAGGWAECYANGPEPEELAALIERGEPLRWAKESGR